jgi:hypothetical protein
MVTPELLSNQYSMLLQKVVSEEIPEADASTLMARIGVKHEELVGVARVSREEKRPVEPELGDTLAEAIKDLSLGVKDLRKLLEEAGQLRPALTEEQIRQMSTPDVVGSSSQQTEVLRKAFGRLPRQEEKGRWVDVEHDQEFYTRFAPNQEPYFYTELLSDERKIWDARWRLARAAFYKKVYGAMTDKLAENQDLIELTKEQMEDLYNVDGVKKALTWYVKAIIEGQETVVNKRGMEITFFDCKSGADFEDFREKLRGYLGEKVIVKLGDKDLKELEREEPLTEEREKDALEVKIKSADAIAWNFIFCSNLVESIDSRYLSQKTEKLVPGFSGKRHGKLPPAICSDDLRAVFHPQEKFEDKCVNGLEWGAYGKWGQTQMDRIKRRIGDYKVNDEKNPDIVEFEKKHNDDLRKKLERERGKEIFDEEWKDEARWVKWKVKYVYNFVGATSLNRFWTDSGVREDKEEKKNIDGKVVERNLIREITVYTPECYPTTSLSSFFEEYKIFKPILNGGDIDWEEKSADPWKISYLTVKLRKAVKLFDHFMRASKIEEGWTLQLLDAFRRLELDKTERGGKPTTKYHNLKVWAYYAPYGGVGRPQDRLFTEPFSGGRVRAGALWTRGTKTVILRKPQIGYLERDERLVLK